MAQLKELVSAMDTKSRLEELENKGHGMTLKEIMSIFQNSYNTSAIEVKDGDLICPKCQNRGSYMFIKWKEGIPYEFAQECQCVKERIETQKLIKNGMEPLMTKTFDNYYAEEKWQKDLLKKAIENTKTDKWFFIGGQRGAGKTHLCAAICRKLLDEKYAVQYSIWFKDFKELNYMFDNRDDYNKKVKQLKNVQVLFIDDLFKTKRDEKVTNTDIQIAWDILNHRAMNKLKTIISCERTLEELYRIDDGLAGRIFHETEGFIEKINDDPKKDMRIAGAFAK